MTFSLRPYQSDIIERTRAALRAHRSVLIQAPTGSGKTALGAFMIARAAECGKRAWFICHRDFLLTQTATAFNQVGVPYGYIAAHWEWDQRHHVQICSISTLARRLSRLAPPNLIIWDEAHHLGARTWQTVYDWAGPACRHVGLTATPARLDGRGLDRFYGAMVCGPAVSWLIDHNFLSGYRAFAPSAPNLTGVHSRAGDYVSTELAGIMDTDTIAGNIIGQYKARAAGKRAIYYAVSVAHSRHLAASFQAAGVAACHLDSHSSGEERVAAARALSDRSLVVLTNVDLFGEGFDLDSLATGASVECVGICRPTQSRSLHLQQLGRVLRPKRDAAIILDHAGNLMRHGLPDTEIEWSLAGIDRKARQSEDGPPVRQCSSCYGVYRAAQRACPYCGAVPAIKSREVSEIAADLAEVNADMLRAAKQSEVQRARGLNDLIRIGAARGYKPGWAHYVWQARQARRRGGRSEAGRGSPDLRSSLTASLDEDV